MLKTIGIAIVALVAVVLIFAATRPDTFSVQRAIDIQAPPEKIFALLDDFHSWGLWSPYEKLDPAMKRTYSGPARGVGAIYAWRSSGKGGVGSMEITTANVPRQLLLNLNFIEPFATSNKVAFDLTPNGAVTKVTWTMSGPLPYMAKVMHLFFNMDRMVGNDFETGLAALKANAEKI
jgi:polyketide cyclase/dehydrase/lipid transport protein